jgi:S1-C subfamily serine protease
MRAARFHRGAVYRAGLGVAVPAVLVSWDMKVSRFLLTLIAPVFLFPALSPAQAPGVPIESAAPLNQNGELLKKLAALRETGRALDAAAAKAALQKPTPAAITLPPCRTTPLRPAEVWETAQGSRLRVGWHFLCHKCDHWHVNLAGGYPITADGVVATCYHVAEPGADIREGRLVAVDGAGHVYPVTSVIARSRTMDACILRVEGLKSEPLPLNDQVRPGDPAFLLSNPLEVSGYFTAGMVNRFFWNKGASPGGEGELKQLRMHVSTDWAPGSSGSPVLDVCGNAISHVAVIAHLGEGKNSTGKPVAHLTVHEGIPARSLMWLLKQAAIEATHPPDAVPVETLTQLQDALDTNDLTRASTIADALEKAGPRVEDKPRLAYARFLIATGQKQEPESAAAAAHLAGNSLKDDGQRLNEVAWKLLTRFPAPQPDTLTVAEKISRRSVDLQAHREPASLDTLARICFLQGKKDEALRLQAEAVDLAGEGMKGQLEKTLADYRSGKLPEVKDE